MQCIHLQLFEKNLLRYVENASPKGLDSAWQIKAPQDKELDELLNCSFGSFRNKTLALVSNRVPSQARHFQPPRRNFVE